MNNKGTMEQKNKLIPELRFPEFVNDGEWKINEVGNLFEITRGYVLPMNMVKDYKSNENPYPVYSSQTKNNGLAGFYTNFLYENAITWTTDGANAGDVNYREGKFYCTNVCGVLINKDGFANKCIAEIINSVTKNYVSYVGNPKLMNGVMSKIKIPVPQIKEQQKIADCLSSLDDLITAHNDKLETLKNHKKGLLQNLFPDPSTSSGQKVPNYRFPEFVNDGEWEEDALGKICDVRDGTHDSPKYVLKGYALITSKNLLTTGEIDSENVNYITENDYQQINKRSKVNIDDILFGMIGTIGNPVIVKKDGFAIKNVALIKSIGMIDQKFLLQQLKSNYILKQFEKENAGGILKFIALGTIRNLNIVIPSISEQKKIEKCLSTIENLITAQTEKVEQLKIHKKGLMQGLFPKIEE